MALFFGLPLSLLVALASRALMPCWGFSRRCCYFQKTNMAFQTLFSSLATLAEICSSGYLHELLGFRASDCHMPQLELPDAALYNPLGSFGLL